MSINNNSQLSVTRDQSSSNKQVIFNLQQLIKEGEVEEILAVSQGLKKEDLSDKDLFNLLVEVIQSKIQDNDQDEVYSLLIKYQYC